MGGLGGDGQSTGNEDGDGTIATAVVEEVVVMDDKQN
jgi:hypothetical protein